MNCARHQTLNETLLALSGHAFGACSHFTVIYSQLQSTSSHRGCSSVVERSLCMWKARGSIPRISTSFLSLTWMSPASGRSNLQPFLHTFAIPGASCFLSVQLSSLKLRVALMKVKLGNLWSWTYFETQNIWSYSVQRRISMPFLRLNSITWAVSFK